MEGKLFTFEGGEGSGKSSQIKALKEYVESKGYEAVVSREPGGPEFSEILRDLLKNPKYKGMYGARAELLLFEAARCETIDQQIKPWLKEGKIVIFDRFYDSTVAYQGYARGLELDTILDLNHFATDGINPDLTFLLDVPVEIGHARVTTEEYGTKDRIESAGLEFHENVRRGYLETARYSRSRIKVIDTEKNDEKQVHEIVKKYVNEKLGIMEENNKKRKLFFIF